MNESIMDQSPGTPLVGITAGQVQQLVLEARIDEQNHTSSFRIPKTVGYFDGIGYERLGESIVGREDILTQDERIDELQSDLAALRIAMAKGEQ